MIQKEQNISRMLCRRSQTLLGCMLVGIALSACDVDLYSHQNEKDLNEMMAVLLNAQIDTHKYHHGDGTYALRVDESDRAKAISLLEIHGLPRKKHLTMQQLFPGDSIVASPLEERARFIFALEQNLQETLSLIDGVLSARVHVVLPENNPFAESTTPSSASVFLKTHSSIDLEGRRSDIKRIVSNSIEGLSYRDVTLTMISSSYSAVLARQSLALSKDTVRSTDLQADQSWSLGSLLLFFGLIAGFLAIVSRSRGGSAY